MDYVARSSVTWPASGLLNRPCDTRGDTGSKDLLARMPSTTSNARPCLHTKPWNLLDLLSGVLSMQPGMCQKLFLSSYIRPVDPWKSPNCASILEIGTF
jgi:hypothetical protein